ncbi:MAG: HEAT repeat domain-containing protein [Nitrospirota bacterium]|nr:HEAT repeat domain-containing protein [Nitrospirota bacterium]
MSLLEHLKAKLESRDAEERREAAVDLGRSGREAVPLLLRALRDQDWRVRKTAVEALVNAGGRDVTAGLVKLLSAEDNAGARNSSIEALVLLGPAAVDDLLSLLSVRDADVRKFAVDILGDIRDPRAVPHLINGLHDHDENVRVAAAEALGKIRDRRAVDPLVACLASSEEGWLDYAAAEALGEIGDDRALKPLLAALGRSSLREPVLESLGRIGNVNTLAPLLSGIDDPLRIVREVSVVALVAIFRKSLPAVRERIVAVVRAALSDRSAAFLGELIERNTGELQKAAVTVTGWSGRTDAVPRLLSLLSDEEMEEPVVQALLSLGAAGVPLLREQLTDERAKVRRVAAMVLGELGRSESEEALIRLLADENGHVRGTAAEALGRLGSRAAIPSLVDLMEDEYESVQESAVKALVAIGDESVLDGLLRDFTTRDAGMRRNIVRLLGRIGTDRASDALVFALKDEEPSVRKAVIVAWDGLSGARSPRPLFLAVADEDPEVRMLAAEALAKTGAPEVADALIPLLKDEDLWVRAAAARGLGKLGAAKHGPVLARHLDRASDIFLLALVDVLGSTVIPEALEPLLGLTEHPDPEVRKTVLQALASYDWARVRPAVLAHLLDAHWVVRKAAVEILKLRREPTAEQTLGRLAEDDDDPSVRQAAREALGI